MVNTYGETFLETFSIFFVRLPFAPKMSTHPLLVLDLNQAQQVPRMPQELFYSCFQQAPPECHSLPLQYLKKYSRIKRHYLFKQRCNRCFESDFNSAPTLSGNIYIFSKSQRNFFIQKK